MLVAGHQRMPGLVAALLLPGAVSPLAVRKGTVWWLRRRTRGDRTEVVLHVALAPELLPGR